MIFSTGSLHLNVYSALFLAGPAAAIAFAIAYCSYREILIRENELLYDRWIAFEKGEELDERCGTFSDESETDEQSGRDERWYEILGVSSQAGVDEINAAWRNKIGRNHPDKVAGLDEEFERLAHERTQKLNAARNMGLSLNRGRRPA